VRPANPFEASARAAKVAALTATLDAAFSESGIDPDSEQAAQRVEALDTDGWTAAAAVSRVRMPSPTTIGWILEAYRLRVAAREAAESEVPS